MFISVGGFCPFCGRIQHIQRDIFRNAAAMLDYAFNLLPVDLPL